MAKKISFENAMVTLGFYAMMGYLVALWLGFVFTLGDGDHDGLSGQEEMALNTNPFGSDTDGDGVLDGVDPDPLRR